MPAQYQRACTRQSVPKGMKSHERTLTSRSEGMDAGDSPSCPRARANVADKNLEPGGTLRLFALLQALLFWSSLFWEVYLAEFAEQETPQNGLCGSANFREGRLRAATGTQKGGVLEAGTQTRQGPGGTRAELRGAMSRTVLRAG
eukprot:8104773-Alexandrium_andersonii.AAC.1